MNIYWGGNGRLHSMRSKLAWPLLPSPYWAVVQKRGERKGSSGRNGDVEGAESQKKKMTPMDAAYAYYYPWSRIILLFSIDIILLGY